MFQIRDAHLDAFAEAAYEAFEDGVLRRLRDVFAEKVCDFTDEDIRNRIRACVPRARSYGLTTQYQVMCFVDTTYLLGEDFDFDPRYSWSRELLASPLPAAEKADCMIESALGGTGADTSTLKDG
jgi:hypothetical protein